LIYPDADNFAPQWLRNFHSAHCGNRVSSVLIRDSKSRNWDEGGLTGKYWCDYTGRRAAGFNARLRSKSLDQ
jgi:hypothetical protein